MSRISVGTTAALLKLLKTGQKVLEIFPGDSLGSEQSLRYIHKITGRKVIAIAMHNIPDPGVLSHMKLIKARVPPYPHLWSQRFDVIFVNQIYDLISAEHPHPHGPVKFKFPVQGISFINKKLKKGGLFILSKVSKAEADIMFKWLKVIGTYSYEYRGDCGVYTKL